MAPSEEAAGGGLSVPLPYMVPFFGLLLSIAIFPLAFPHFWEQLRWQGLVVAVFSLAFIIPFGVQFGGLQLVYELVHTLLLEYISFISLIFSLYVTAGGVVIEGAGDGKPMTSFLTLLIGTVLASVVGTTGASMLLIRPVLRSLHGRKHKVHTFVFFIFLVSNIGGVLTPIGDPPVFLGFLKGVDFFWTLINMLPHWAFTAGILLVIYLPLDMFLYNREMVGHSRTLLVRDTEATLPEVPEHELEEVIETKKILGTAVDATPLQSEQATLASTPATVPGELDTEANVADLPVLPDAAMDNAAFSAPTEPSSPSLSEPTLPAPAARPSKWASVRKAVRGTPLPAAVDAAVDKAKVDTMVDGAKSDAVVIPPPEHSRGWHTLQLYVRFGMALRPGLSHGEKFDVRGWYNCVAVLIIVGLVIASGYLNKAFPYAGFTVMNDPADPSHGIFWSYFNIGRDVLLTIIGVLSFFFTARRIHRDNNFSFAAFNEVAVLFTGIFICLIPILIMFESGASGPLGFLINAIDTPTEYFWATGALSSFLDNSPTYLLFFNMAGGDPEELMGPKAAYLKAITAGAVFMGANTYIGNAPNFLVRNICTDNGVRMPSFFGYMAYSIGIACPVFFLVTLVFFPWW
ncbi:hypothetical protein DFJ74DRAFT_643683 [Hyaloraphidium curvatum]|nr:hypothetical protein DFJ74DRAFT_643683 [Hyaloraphidium curvatum]